MNLEIQTKRFLQHCTALFLFVDENLLKHTYSRPFFCVVSDLIFSINFGVSIYDCMRSITRSYFIDAHGICKIGSVVLVPSYCIPTADSLTSTTVFIDAHSCCYFASRVANVLSEKLKD